MSEYVNCLLTAMSEGVLHLVEIAASEPVPNLVDLTAGHKDLREWIEAKQFPFQSLDAKKVIRALRQSAEISGPPFSTKRGDMLTVHPQDDGSRVARVFDIQVGPFNRWARVELAAEDDPRVIALQRQIDAQNAG